MPESLSYNDLISSVVDKLLSNFSSEIPTIYKDTPIQGMVKPCFFNFWHFNLSKKNLVFKGFFTSAWINLG